MRDFIFNAALLCFMVGNILCGAIIVDDILRRDETAKKKFAPPTIYSTPHPAPDPSAYTISSIHSNHAVYALPQLKCPECGIYYTDPAVLRPCGDCITKTANPK